MLLAREVDSVVVAERGKPGIDETFMMLNKRFIAQCMRRHCLTIKIFLRAASD